MESIGGVYEICIGTQHLEATVEYWTQFGFSIGIQGDFSAGQAQILYGVHSPLTSWRLNHQNADHGLIRLMQWEQPTNEGLGLRNMRACGNRWGAMMTQDVLAIANHAEIARLSGHPIYADGPMWDVIYEMGENFRPFIDQPVGVRELLLFRPESRQFVFQRYNYHIPTYGRVNEASPLKASQFTHVGLIIQDDSKEVLHFYDEILGLMCFNEDEWVSTYDNSETARSIFNIGPGEEYASTNFDDPRSSKDDWKKARSGRLKIIRYPESLAVENVHHLARPGSLGMSLYTYRVQDINDYHQRVSQSTAQEVTPVVVNELGEPSFSFIAPDGYFWALVQHPDQPS
ncbi:MAG: VOC family protein [Merismopedia sp. SIO2A8]|nr:VOC family protein [Symploca sp. SIO2B6]NET50078.1 VOC family protein [Merismopedia sp. SIO2A8]